MKRIFALVLSILVLVTAVGCSPASPGAPAPPEQTASPKKLSLEDADDLLDMSRFLPESFEKVDAASEGISNADLGLGPDWSEVQLFLSSDPFQMMYGMMGIYESRLEGAMFDRMMEDEEQIKELIITNIQAGAEESGSTVNVPEIIISHPSIGDSAILGEGTLESFGVYFGFDTCWFRSKGVYVIFYSLNMAEDKVSLRDVCREIESRLSKYSY